jgi:carboxylesterase
VAAVIEGAQPWFVEAGSTGVLLLHGFSGNPVCMRPLAQALVGEGHSIALPRLPGHGTDWRDMAATDWRDWAREAIEALEQLRRTSHVQVIVGLSMGATLALHLAAARDDLAGLVLVNPALHTRDPRLKALGILKWVLPSVPGVGNDIARPGGDEQAYDRVPLRAVASLLDLQRTVRARLRDVSCPCLVMTSRQDHVVDPSDSTLVVQQVHGPTEHVWLERSYHVATLDYDAELVTARTLAFVRARTERDGP